MEPMFIWAYGIIFHQPGFPWNSWGFPLLNHHLGEIGRVRSRANLTRMFIGPSCFCWFIHRTWRLYPCGTVVLVIIHRDLLVLPAYWKVEPRYIKTTVFHKEFLSAAKLCNIAIWRSIAQLQIRGWLKNDSGESIVQEIPSQLMSL